MLISDLEIFLASDRGCFKFHNVHLLKIFIVLSVQEVVTHFYCKLLFKMGNYFLDTQELPEKMKIKR